MYSVRTGNIEVSVEPVYLEEESEPDDNRFFWAYQVHIANDGDTAVQLLSRYWRITDGLGRVEEVRGPGVVGEQPIIAPGGQYEYTSGCPLPTPSGIMQGYYTMSDPEGHHFEVHIPAFSLDIPGTLRTVN
ncbi:Co2+/Mg2+ efflux protein ApaG [Zhengella mangrovi]|uniref:Protein ApaG n=1 Tax=Zhengella mangrovi TaxID=1982044 RepID=A0A2G1QIX3_9HYPH|nr:Co2+/Mg2+ efflux protein ApaG [Zhengella mangrovi]PHP65476.1 Co2+/Mg2+ efflux protein ApaG [Zhengella mangrovi]